MSLQKDQLSTKKDSNGGHEGQKAVRHMGNNKLARLSPSLLVIIINVSQLNSPNKRQRETK